MLAASSEAYDRGSHWEAKRLASVVYAIAHDHGAIKSPLTQLGYKEKMRFLSSGKMVDSPPDAKPILTSPVKFDSPHPPKVEPKFRFFGDRTPPAFPVDFETWWKDELIFARGADVRLNRYRLVGSLRNQDGGGHVGRLTDLAYVDLKRGAGLSRVSSDGTESDMAYAL
jgi:hypothetical protein